MPRQPVEHFTVNGSADILPDISVAAYYRYSPLSGLFVNSKVLQLAVFFEYSVYSVLCSISVHVGVSLGNPAVASAGLHHEVQSSYLRMLCLSLYSTFQRYPFSFEKPSVDISIGYLFLKGKSWEKTVGIFIDHPSPKLGIFILSMII